MTPERRKELENMNTKLTPEEISEGWHFCNVWDGMLCHPDSPEAEVCGCPLRNAKSPVFCNEKGEWS